MKTAYVVIKVDLSDATNDDAIESISSECNYEIDHPLVIDTELIAITEERPNV